MDEPLASLDATRKNEILPFIERLRDELELPIVYVSHDLNEVIRLADTMVLLSDGGVAAIGPVEDLTSRLDLYPLTGRYEAGAALATKVAGHDSEFNLTFLEFSGGRFTVPKIDLPIGAPLRLRVRARDVSLSLEKHTNTSVLNILKGVVKEMSETGESQIEVRLDVGAPLIAGLHVKPPTTWNSLQEKPFMLWSKQSPLTVHPWGAAATGPASNKIACFPGLSELAWQYRH